MTTPKTYELKQLVAETGGVAVWRGWDPLLRRPVAIKQVAADAGEESARLRTEARLLGGLSHPNIVSVLDLVESPDHVWLIEEWVDGTTLPTILRDSGRLSAPQAVGVLHGALQGLAYVHARGVTHGDVSPTNILVDKTGTSKLIDFGAASVDGRGAMSGTPGYLSPQVVRGAAATARDDVYAVGAVLTTLLRGRPLFVGTSAESVLAAQLDAGEPELSGVPAAMRAVLRTALATAPERRYADAAEMLTALDEAANNDYGPNWLAEASLVGVVSAVITGAAMTGTAPTVVSGQGSTVRSTPRAPRPARAARSAGRAGRHTLGFTGPASVVATVAVLVAAVVVAVLAVRHATTHPRAAAAGAPTLTRSPAPQTSGTASLPGSPSTGPSSAPTSASTSAHPGPLRWSEQKSVVSGSFPLARVSCAADGFCAAVDDSGNAYTFDGSGWDKTRLVSQIFDDDGLAVSCASSTFCLVVRNNGAVWAWNGATWSQPGQVSDLPAGGGQFGYSDVSCPTTRFCAVNDSGGLQVFTFDGTRWSDPTTIPHDSEIASGPFECESTAFCVAIITPRTNDSAEASTYVDGVWSTPIGIDPSTTVYSVSCATAQFCATVADQDYVTWNGRKWNQPTQLPVRVTSVSCAAPEHCLAVGGHDVITIDGTKQSVQHIDKDANLVSISCGSLASCVAFDDKGNALVGS